MEKNSTQKKLIRKEVLNTRIQLSPDTIEKAGSLIRDHVISVIEEGNFTSVLLYADFRNEVPTGGIYSYCMEKHIKVGYPRCAGDHSMAFYEVKSENDLSSGYQGILEPDLRCPLMEPAVDSAIVILPCVSADRQGHRLGYGGGFYDRYLAERPKLFRLALAYDFQIMEGLPAEEHDMSMDMIITEHGAVYKKKH